VHAALQARQVPVAQWLLGAMVHSTCDACFEIIARNDMSELFSLWMKNYRQTHIANVIDDCEVAAIHWCLHYNAIAILQSGRVVFKLFDRIDWRALYNAPLSDRKYLLDYCIPAVFITTCQWFPIRCSGDTLIWSLLVETAIDCQWTGEQIAALIDGLHLPGMCMDRMRTPYRTYYNWRDLARASKNTSVEQWIETTLLS
jgi:hypothetical protein